MSHEPTFRYYIVEGASLELLRTYKAAMVNMIEDRENLGKEFEKRAQAQSDQHQNKLRDIWRRLAASVGLDPDATWGNPDYQIEARYLDDGFGAVLYSPQQANPLRELFGGEPTKTPEDPALALPPKGTTRH